MFYDLRQESLSQKLSLFLSHDAKNPIYSESMFSLLKFLSTIYKTTVTV